MAPMFSIITVTRNAATTIGVTLQSVKCQTCHLYEYIIQDGASTDDTLRIISDSGVENLSLVTAPDEGIYYAMNAALSRATGDYVIFLNAGDTFHTPDTLQKIADAVMDNDYPGVVYGQTDIVDKDRRYIAPRHLQAPEVLTPMSMADGMVVCHQAFIVLRKIAPKFDTKYRFSADYDWCIRCLVASRRNLYMPTTLIDYLNEGLTTKNHRRSLIERYKIMCHYYGTVKTTLRHVKFFFRHNRRKKQLHDTSRNL